MGDRVLIVAAHPDDEVLGCGGAAWSHAQGGDSVRVLLLAEGATSRGAGNELAATRLREAAGIAARTLGIQPPRLLGFADNRLDSIDLLDLVHAIEDEARPFAPTIVYAHHPSDCNLDHTLAHRACLAAFRPLPDATVRSLRLFEVPSSSEWGSRTAPPFRAQWFQPLAAAAMEAKLAALACYGDELRPWPHPRSAEGVRALAAVRGSAVGVPAAEAFAIEFHRIAS